MFDLGPPDILELILPRVGRKAGRAYLDAVAANVEDPTLLILDLRDRRARAIAELAADPVVIRVLVAGALRLEKRPDLVVAYPRSSAALAVATQDPAIGSGLAATGAESGYLAVVMAFEACRVFEIRNPADRPSRPARRSHPTH